MKEPFEISQEVKAALARSHPVVALESSVIAQGLPGKKGAEAARDMIAEIRKEDCTPAVIGIIEGSVKVGLSDEEIARLAESPDVVKCSTRELAQVVVEKRDGATTVAATVYLAAGAGIPIVATGGIGGVHRGASESWDVSADLWELVKTSCIVVCSGAKAVLGLPATLEWLETHQVPAYGFGTEEFPAFYSAKSGLSVPKLGDADKVSELYVARLGLGLRTGMVVGVPVPEKDAVDLSKEIEQAVSEARESAVTGAALTPWLLARVQELSGGKAINANIALLKNNARTAARIAKALVTQHEKRIGFLAR
jgi:pseudouridine-5'-phosphate glycosidase